MPNLQIKGINDRFYPLRTFLIILAIVFASETAVMFLLPAFFPTSRPVWLEAFVDACLLTAMLSPVLGLLIVRPLMHAATIRKRLLERFLVMQEEERRRVARDIHDEIGQALTSVLVGLRNVADAPSPDDYRERLEGLRSIVTQALREMERFSHGLRPVALDYLGLDAALERLAEDFTRMYHIPVKLETGILANGRLPPHVEIALYRIIQEALTNTARHAKATHVRIAIHRAKAYVEVTVEDDGCGFDVQATIEAPGSHMRLGLSGMRERAALLGGTLSIDSKRGRGTRVVARIPLAESSRE